MESESDQESNGGRVDDQRLTETCEGNKAAEDNIPSGISSNKGASPSAQAGLPQLCEPYVGMELESLDAAEEFYESYGRRVGFTIRKRRTRRSQRNNLIINRQYVCSREGFSIAAKRNMDNKRPSSRQGCNAMLRVAVKDGGKWFITAFVKEHNHEPKPDEIPSHDQGLLSAYDAVEEPYEGMVFESHEAARAFYDEYARRTGFMTRVINSKKSERDGELVTRGLGCRCRPYYQTSDLDWERDDCTAMFLVKREKPGQWILKKFIKDHSHPLVDSGQRSSLSSDEKDKKIQELNAEIRVKKRASTALKEQLLSYVKYMEDHNEHLTAKVREVVDNIKLLESTRSS